MKTKEELDSMSTKNLLMHYRQQRNGIISGAFTISDNYDEEDHVNNIGNDTTVEHLEYLDDILSMLSQRQDLGNIMRKESMNKINLN